MKQVGFGIIGCGTIAHFHARAIAEVKGARLNALSSRNSDHAQSVAKSAANPVDIHNDLDEMLRRKDIDAVCICTPSGAHLESAVKAARAGKHVIVEKPLEITLARCDALIRECSNAKVLLCAIFPSRFSDVNQELKKAIDSGRFGKLTLADTTVKWWRPQEYYDSGVWRGTWNLDGGGALMNQAIHNVDLLQWLMGPVDQIVGFTGCLAHEHIEVEDTAVAALRFQTGAMGMIEAATSAHPGLLKTIGIHGDRGSAIVEQDHLLKWEISPPRKTDLAIREKFKPTLGSTGGAADPKAISHLGHARQIANFVKSLRNGGQLAVDGAEGRKSVELILAIYQSQWTQKIVKLPLARDPKFPTVRRS